MNKTQKTLILISIIVTITTSLHAKDKKRIAVLDFSANNIAGSYARTVRNKFEIILYDFKRFKLLERNMINVILAENNIKSDNCSSKLCALEIGKALSADYIVLGSVDHVNNYTINTRVIDIRTNSIFFINSISFKNRGEMIDFASILAEKVSDAIYNRYRTHFLNITLQTAYIQPIGGFRGLFSHGLSFSASFGIDNVFIKNLNAGLSAGFNWFPGTSDDEYGSMVPLTLYTNYRFMFGRYFFARPQFSFGISYNTYKETDTTTRGLSACIIPAVSLGFLYKHSFGISLNVGYNLFIESNAYVQFLAYGVTLNYRF